MTKLVYKCNNLEWIWRANRYLTVASSSHLVIRASLQSAHETVSLAAKCKKAVAQSPDCPDNFRGVSYYYHRGRGVGIGERRALRRANYDSDAVGAY